MKFLHISVGLLLACTLAACNFSLAEDITPPPGAVLTPVSSPVPTATEIATSAASTASNGVASGSPAPATAGTASPAGNVTISGKVTNGSGGLLPSGLTASLHGILNQQETLTLSMPLNQDGSYSFENVALTNGMEFLVAVQYGPVSFLSAGGTFDGKTSSYDQPITIYDSSSDLTGLSLDQVHIQATFSTAGQIQLDEIYVLTNPGKKAVTVATDGTTLPFATVPDGALQPSISLSQGSAQLVMADTGFAMLPGTQQYAFVVSFSLDYSNNKASISQPFILSPASITVIVPVGVKVSGVGLADQGASDFQGSSYQIYSTGPLNAGAALGLTFSGSSQTAATGSSNPGISPYLLVGLGFVGLLLVAAGVLLFLRDRRRARVTVQGEMIKPETMDDETARLADAILALDDRFADGKVDRQTYQQQRAELKEKLKSRL
ncbi:MAG: hypothetical protein ABSA23_07115 [Anaerolineales bacterium]|jgi:hypothetical protein